jgi:hypothetical protein
VSAEVIYCDCFISMIVGSSASLARQRISNSTVDSLSGFGEGGVVNPRCMIAPDLLLIALDPSTLIQPLTRDSVLVWRNCYLPTTGWEGMILRMNRKRDAPPRYEGIISGQRKL